MEPETSSRLFFRVFWFFLSLSSGWCYCLAALRIELLFLEPETSSRLKLALGFFRVFWFFLSLSSGWCYFRCSEDRVEWSQKLALGCFFVYFGSFSVCPADGITASLL